MSIRLASSMVVVRGGRIENAHGGVDEIETCRKALPWCDFSGMADGRHVGIANLDHETSLRYPTGWHVRNSGLMTANCFAWSYLRPDAGMRGEVTLPKGSGMTWRYRLFIHRGDARTDGVAMRFAGFVVPPQVSVH
ncbi:MAG: hypothetical protein AMXMBFR4_15190 [Candidatus Hydrogenedentota bacterium]